MIVYELSDSHRRLISRRCFALSGPSIRISSTPRPRPSASAVVVKLHKTLVPSRKALRPRQVRSVQKRDIPYAALAHAFPRPPTAGQEGGGAPELARQL